MRIVPPCLQKNVSPLSDVAPFQMADFLVNTLDSAMSLVHCPTLGLCEASAGETFDVKLAIGNIELSHVEVTVVESVVHQLGLIATPVFLFEIETMYREKEREGGEENDTRLEKGFQVVRNEDDFKVLNVYPLPPHRFVHLCNKNCSILFSPQLGAALIAPKHVLLFHRSAGTSGWNNAFQLLRSSANH